jgi:glyoxylate carboligase
MSNGVKYSSVINPGRHGGFDWTIRGSLGIVKSGTDRTLVAAQNNSREAMEILSQAPPPSKRPKKRG